MKLKKLTEKISLKNKIFAFFILCSLGVVIAKQNIDYIYWDIIDPVLNPELTNVSGFAVSRVVYFIVNIGVTVGGAAIFYRLTAKALKRESDRRVKEQSLVYAALAHDLKTPMTSVQGFAKALADGKIKPEEQQEIFGIIYRKSNSMNDMVNMLFDYAGLGADGYKPNFADVDITTLVRDIAAENYTELEDRGIELDTDIPDGPITVNADKAELKRALTNLAVNVYKHNPSGIRAKISVAKDGGRVTVTVADSGRPLPDMDIFEPFVTENEARTQGGGTGLGLAITKRIINRHGGSIIAVNYENSSANGYAKAFVVVLDVKP